ncbi:hypothetical protein PV327_004335 [Microctonus hyperodae]|uniref:Uncharacterized protein n=1 Tax=Microctonus hyperodae TaxID=165561 RepID=A0AA39FCC8_MICHY|nr:hypothetical protein PV327_004335 [Microctonus hyperodae]
MLNIIFISWAICALDHVESKSKGFYMYTLIDKERSVVNCPGFINLCRMTRAQHLIQYKSTRPCELAKTDFHGKFDHITENTIILVLVLKHECTNAYQLNLTKLIEDRLGTQYHVVSQSHHEYPSIILKDITYLPENNYVDDESNEHTRMQQQQQLLLRDVDNDDRTELLRNNRNSKPDYQNLCAIRTRKVQLEDSEFEYQPPHYYEIYCKNHFLDDKSLENSVKPAKQMCVHQGFHCIQRSRTLFMAKRRWTSDCWEPFTKEIPSGCDCMWPVFTLGDITAHY